MINSFHETQQQSNNGSPSVDENGVWICLNPQSVEKAKDITKSRPALFLDRDGVINVDVNYLSKVEDVVLHEGAASMIAQANKAGLPVIVITNQSGVGRGYFDWDRLNDVQNEIARQLNEEGAHWDGVFACPYHRDGQPPYKHDDHPYRKPNPGMLKKAAEIFTIDLSKSWVIGDKADDLKAGINAGLCGGIHVSTRYLEAKKEREKAEILNSSDFTVLTADTVQQACQRLPLLIDV